MALIGELLETIERHPPGIEARKLLAYHYISVNWMEAARDSAQELSKLSPLDNEIKALLSTLKDVGKPPPPYTPQTISNPIAKPAVPTTPRISLRSTQPVLSKDQDARQRQLAQGYESLLDRAKNLLRETTLLRDLTQGSTEPATPTTGSSIMNVLGSFFSSGKKKDDNVAARFEKHIPDLAAISEGRISSVVRVQQPGSVRTVARAMQKKPDKAVDIAFDDLEAMARWLSSPSSSSSPLDNDGVREALVKRVRGLEAALPDTLKAHSLTALMHVEHEVFKKSYIGGDTTMLGDPVSEIARASFLVTEDGYAWVCSIVTRSI